MRKYLLTILLLLALPAGMLHAQDTVARVCIDPDSVIGEAMKYIGVPYRWGGKTPKGFDCAGFTRYIYSKFGVMLAPSAAPQYKMGIPVDKDSLAVGDLVFYSGRRNLKTIGHVGIVTTVRDGGFDFIHASSTGIRLTTSQEAYYQKRYQGACRIIDREEVAAAGLPLASTDTVTDEQLYTIAMVGDMMLGTLYPTPLLPRHEGKRLFDDTKHLLRGATISVGKRKHRTPHHTTASQHAGHHSHVSAARHTAHSAGARNRSAPTGGGRTRYQGGGRTRTRTTASSRT